MLKKSVIVVVLIVVAATGLLRVTRLRVALDGTGKWPRFFSRRPDYDALDADRARQRAQAPPPTTDLANAGPTNAGPDKVRPTDVGRTFLGPPGGETVAAASSATSSHGYWPDFRGPNRDGRYDGPPIRTDWPADGLKPLWKQPIGLGYASFVVADGRAFTIEQRRQQEVVAAYDVATGRELWTNGWDAEFVETMGGDGPRATPTYDEGRIYALGAQGELRCLDAQTGVPRWRRNILNDAGASNLEWGMAAAPLIVDGTVIVLPGGPNGKSVAAYDKTTGRPVWTSLSDQQAYTSPMLVTIGGVRQLLVVSAERAMGLTVDQGKLLWEYPWVTEIGINVAQPLLLGNDRIFLSAGYGHGAAVIQLEPSGDRFKVGTVWKNTRMKNKFTSSVLRDGYIYGLDEAILTCLDAATGALKWKGGHYGYGQTLLAGEHLIVISEDGDLALVKATPERYVELSRFPAIDGKTWNHPVIVDGRLLVRNIQEMAAFDLRPK